MAPFWVTSPYIGRLAADSGKETALLENFAARLSNEVSATREALEQQTATCRGAAGDGDPRPATSRRFWSVMLEKALTLCEADVGSFWSSDRQDFQVVASPLVGDDLGRIVSPPAGAFTRTYRTR